MKIVFMGTPNYATTILSKLIDEKFNIVALFTQPDKKVGRKQLLTPPHIKQYCITNNLDIPIYQPTTLKDESVKNSIAKLEPDFIIVAAYGQILPKSILDIAPCINLHASLLPLYRGASPIQSAILNDDKYTGVTSMLMEEGLDSGDILGFNYIKIGQTTNVMELFEQLSQLAATLTVDTLNKFDMLKPKKQNQSQVTYCKKIVKDDGLIEFVDAKNVYLKYKAYKFWPEIFLDSKLKIKECKLIDTDSSNGIGEILEINKEYIIVGCQKGKLKITKVQPASKKAMNVVDYIRGARLEVGNSLS